MPTTTQVFDEAIFDPEIFDCAVPSATSIRRTAKSGRQMRTHVAYDYRIVRN